MRHLRVSAGVDGTAENEIGIFEPSSSPDDVLRTQRVNRDPLIGIGDFDSTDESAEIRIRVFTFDDREQVVQLERIAKIPSCHRSAEHLLIMNINLFVLVQK